MTQTDRSEYKKQWHLKHKEKQNQRSRDWHTTHKQERSERISAYYQGNPVYFKEHVRNRRQEIRELIQQQKADLFCARCGNTDVRVLDFHHRDKSSKEITIAAVAQRGWGNERILRELAKCDALCANCHRIHHWEERNGD